MTNVSNRNSLLTLTPFSEPGRGLSTVVQLTYNSLEEHSDSPMGNNWSLSMSGLTRFGDPLDVHPNNADSIAGRSNKFINLVDGSGRLLTFTGVTGSDGVTFWEEPPGVRPWLRQVSSDTSLQGRFWAFTRPDRVTFFYDSQGFPTAVTDKNGNTLTFTLSAVQSSRERSDMKAARIWSVGRVTRWGLCGSDRRPRGIGASAGTACHRVRTWMTSAPRSGWSSKSSLSRSSRTLELSRALQGAVGSLPLADACNLVGHKPGRCRSALRQRWSMRVPAQPPPNPYLPAGLLRLTDAASHLRIWPVELAQAIREGRVAMVLGRAGELLIAQEEMERVRRKGSRGVEVRGARRTSPNEPR